MIWSVLFPNLLIGLREGLEAGLVVTILVGAVRRLAPERSLTAVWTGVVSAAALSLSFGAVLTFTRAELTPRGQEIFGGSLSLVAVVLVTWMIFWMRRTARSIASDLRGRVGAALLAGGPALVITAFVAVAREGLETALFLWTNAQAAGSTTSPLLGGLVGVLIAAVLCVALYRRVVKINLARFFTITGAALVVIVAGVFAYGLRDLQDAGVLPGINSTAFDISRSVPSGSWWTELVRGITNLDNRMSWLQVGAYLAYLVIVLSLFLYRPRRTEPAPADEAAPVTSAVSGMQAWRRPGVVGVVLAILLPAVAAGIWVAADHSSANTTQANRITVHSSTCAPEWAAPESPRQTYSVTNSSGRAVDVEIVESASNAVIAEIEVLGPATTRDLPATFGSSSYQWKCVYSGLPTRTSRSYAMSTSQRQSGPVTALKPTTQTDLRPVLTRYRAFVAAHLSTLKGQLTRLQLDLAHGDRPAARRDWLSAHLTYHRIGAAYNAFGAAGDAVDGLAQGLPAGIRDHNFVGFHRLEHDLWSNTPTADVRAESAALTKAVDKLYTKLDSFTFDANDVTIRAHEIVEDTVRFTLTGQDDYGSGSGYRTALADLAGDRVLVDLLAPLLNERSPRLVGTVYRNMARLQSVLDAAARTGHAVGASPPAQRQKVNAATSQLAETLAPIPDLLEIRAR